MDLASAVLELPTDRPRAALRGTGTVAAGAPFPPELLAHPHLALAAVAAWLHRITNQVDLVVSLHDARGSAPVRIDASGDPAWSTFAEAVRIASEASDGAPAFAGQVSVCIGGPPQDAAGPELALGLHGDRVEATAAADLFDEASLQRLVGHLSRLAHAAGNGAGDVPLSALPLLGNEERELVVSAWNRTGRPFSDDATVHGLIARRSALSPDRIAVIDAGERLTYRELDERANRLARHLGTLGVGPGSLVGIHLERDHGIVVAALAIMKAGAAYVPLDPSFPADRLAFIAEDAELATLVTQDALAGRLALATSIPEVRMDGDRAAIDAHAATDPEVACSARDTMYVIHTSGSTGRPKGVVLEHRSVVNFLESMAVEPGFGADDVLLAVTTLSFDIAGLELYLPLMCGGTVVVASRAATVDPAMLLDSIREHGVTVLQATPATWRMLVEGGWAPGSTPSLRAFCGGEALPAALAEQLLERTAEAWNLYGPTETTIWSTVQRIEPDAPVSIGRPIANTILRVLDASGAPVPIGVPGELLIGGDGLARGYHRRPDLTAERFVPDPLSDDPGDRLYRTGDLVRWRPGGRLEFIGRVDHQVKIRGFRIELGEIETVLGRHADVEEAIVIAAEDAAGDKRLVAYVTLGRDATASRIDLRRSVQDVLPAYMVPSTVVVLDAMPRTPNGKTDRKALPAVDWSDVERDSPYVAPTGDIERRLAALWEEVLEITPIGADDDLFSLGVTSLATARLMGRIEREFRTGLPVGAFFSAPTVAELAALLGAGVPDPEWPSLVAITPIHPGSTQPPVFGVHGGAGTVLLYAELARRLGPDRPFYGLHAQGLYGRDPVHTSVADMAGAYLEQMRQVQPHGPYTILGYCFGGHVAHEIAVRLRAEGEDVDLVGQINSPSVHYLRTHRPVFDETGALTGRDGVMVREWQPATAGRRASLPRRVFRRIRSRVRRLRFRAAIRLHRPLPAIFRENLSFQTIAHHAEDAYVPPVSDVRTVVWRAQGLYFEDDLGWRSYVTGEVICVEIPGEQPIPRTTMTEPFVGHLADSLLNLREGASAELLHPLVS
jgi:amino acid adenylation domain-containing protein